MYTREKVTEGAGWLPPAQHKIVHALHAYVSRDTPIYGRPADGYIYVQQHIYS